MANNKKKFSAFYTSIKKKSKNFIKNQASFSKKNFNYLYWKSMSLISRPIISIILPTHDSGDNLRKCINSLINQSLKNIEIICVVANPNANTKEILHEYVNSDSRVKVINSNKENYSSQLNMGLDFAKGKYVSFVQVTDSFKEDTFERLLNMTEKFTVELSKFNNNSIFKENSHLTEEMDIKPSPENIFSVIDFPNILKGYPVINGTIYRNDFLKKNNIRFLEFSHEYQSINYFFFETLLLANKISFDNRIIYYVDSNFSSFINNPLNLINVMNNILDLIENYDIKDENILVVMYEHIFFYVRNLLNCEGIKGNHGCCLKIQTIMRSLDKNIINKYFDKDTQEVYGAFINFYNDHPNLLLIPSDNNKTSGAFLSMANLAYILKNKYHINVFIVLPCKGHGTEVLKSLNLNYDTINSEDWVVPLSIERDDIFKKSVENKIKTNKKAIKRLKKYIYKNNIDIIHINTTYSYVGAIAARETNTPVVWHLREFLEEDQSNTLWDREKGNELINESNRIIAISGSIFKKYENVFDANKLVKIYNGIDANRFYKPNKTIFNHEKIRMVMVGGFEYYKGQIELAKALAIVFERGYDNFEIDFIGLGQKIVQDEVKKIFEKAKMSHLVNFLGYKSDVENYYITSDISFTCAKSEAFGRTTVEAMLSGNLLIGANSAGTKELVKDNETGILYEPNDSEDLAEKIIYVLNNKNTAQKIAEVGRNYMYENMTAEKNADNIYNLYQEIFKENFEKFFDNYDS